MKNIIEKLGLITLMAATLISCEETQKREELETGFKEKEIEIKVGELYNLEYQNPVGDLKWSTDNRRIADVREGVVTGICRGETKVYANEESCRVTVEPSVTYFNDPMTEWGSNKKDVERYMIGYEKKLEDANTLAYDGNSVIARGYMYKFDNGILNTCAVVCLSDFAAEIGKHLSERYLKFDIDQENYEITLVDPTLKETLVLISFLDVDNIIIMYGSIYYLDNKNAIEKQIRKAYGEKRDKQGIEKYWKEIVEHFE